jgi:hypothetical protein
MYSAMAERPRILLTGSLAWRWPSPVRARLAYWRDQLPGAVLVHGAARGADSIGSGIWRGWGLPDEPHPLTPTDWRGNPRGAGHARNRAMAALGADVCVAFILDGSGGSTATVATCRAAGIRVDLSARSSRDPAGGRG